MHLKLFLVVVAAFCLVEARPSTEEQKLLSRLEDLLKRQGSEGETTGDDVVQEGSVEEGSQEGGELDEVTKGKLWAIGVEYTELGAKCEIWWKIVQEGWINPKESGILGHVCPRLTKAWLAYQSATPEEKAEMDASFLADLDRVYAAGACTNLFVTKEQIGQWSDVLKGEQAKQLFDHCDAVFGSYTEAENEVDADLEKAVKAPKQEVVDRMLHLIKLGNNHVRRK